MAMESSQGMLPSRSRSRMALVWALNSSYDQRSKWTDVLKAVTLAEERLDLGLEPD